MILRLVVAFAAINIFLTAEANGQLFKRFRGDFGQPNTQQRQHPQQANGFQGRLRAKPRSRADDSNGRPNMFRNGSVRQNWQTLGPNATNPPSKKPLGPQVDLAAQFRANAIEQTRRRPKKGLLGLLSPAQDTKGLALNKPKVKASAPVPDLANTNKTQPQPKTAQASPIPTSDMITNPAPTGLSLWSPVTPSNQVVPASAIQPAADPRDKLPKTAPQEAFSVLQKNDQ